MPSQRAIGGGELLAARAGIGPLLLHLYVYRGGLVSRQADSRARFIGEPAFCGSDLEAPRRQAGRLIAASPVGWDRARFAGVEVLDGDRDIGKGRAAWVRHHAGKARAAWVRRDDGKARARLGVRCRRHDEKQRYSYKSD